LERTLLGLAAFAMGSAFLAVGYFAIRYRAAFMKVFIERKHEPEQNLPFTFGGHSPGLRTLAGVLVPGMFILFSVLAFYVAFATWFGGGEITRR
jgi:hypothetical protein